MFIHIYDMHNFISLTSFAIDNQSLQYFRSPYADKNWQTRFWFFVQRTLSVWENFLKFEPLEVFKLYLQTELYKNQHSRNRIHVVLLVNRIPDVNISAAVIFVTRVNNMFEEVLSNVQYEIVGFYRRSA